MIKTRIKAALKAFRYPALIQRPPPPPRYIGRAAVYLAADKFSAFTTGMVLKLDGGISLYNHRVAQEPPVPTPDGG